ncbi:Hypothetical predicted protein [Octopus vulgaris]|uniref:SEFIR domain-containing protein n=1 Tax=Octopus vulgaris TaxID=6645 RepID=A0AA36AQM9_OCTVU|nr:Hypothetical predicted protein [Octopus vulgaris]
MSSCLVLLFYVFVLLFTFGEFVRLSQEDSCDPSCSILPKDEDRKFICNVHKEERCHNVNRELERNRSKGSIPSWQKYHYQSSVDIPARGSSTVTDVTFNNISDLYTSASARPQIAGITIHDEQRTCFNDYRRNNFALNFTLLLPSGEFLYKTTALLLKIEYDVQPSKNTKCRIFEFKTLGTIPDGKYEKRYIQYNFLTRFEKFKTHVFKVKLIALPTGGNSTYIVTAYVNSLNVNKKRTIAVSIDSENSLHVVFEPSRQYVADSYNVSLIRFPTFIPDPISSVIVQQQQLPGNLTELEFTDIQPGNYRIQVSVISSDCEVQLCKTMNSTSFVMGSPQKNTGRTMSSKPVTTTTTFIKHRMSSTSGMVKTTTPETRSTSRRQGDVVIQPSDQSGEYERSLKIMLGTVFGVVGSVTIIIVVFCMYRKRNYTSGSHIEHPQLSDVIIEDFDMKQHFPNVLLLYSSDCCAHEYVVQAMAAFLMQICNCNVHIDLFEEHLIQEKGLNDWLLDNMQEAEYIIVLCSVGSRLRCKKNMQFKLHPHRTIPDYFALAVDYVAEKMRIERCKGMSLSKFIVLYMDYSVEGDIPAQLDLAQKFMMMRDVSNLVCQLHGLSLECSKFSPFSGITTKNYDKSETESEEGFEVQRGKSRSLPVVSRTAKSLTVLEAEVHKEWDPESKPHSGSPPPEGDSSSNEGELELDLLSIKIPANFRHVFYSPHQDPAELIPCLYNNKNTNVIYRPNHKRGSSGMGSGNTNSGGFVYHRASEDIRSLCRQLPTLEPLPRCVSLDDGSSTSYDSVAVVPSHLPLFFEFPKPLTFKSTQPNFNAS